MSIWKVPFTLEAINKRCVNTLASHLKIEFTEMGSDYLTAKMPVGAHVLQPLGIMNGGASCALAETVASMAANLCVDFPRFYCVGLDINTNHLRQVSSGDLFAVARPFHVGQSTQVWSIEVRDEKERLISISRLTLVVLSQIP